jgi:hypothetical protein
MKIITIMATAAETEIHRLLSNNTSDPTATQIAITILPILENSLTKAEINSSGPLYRARSDREWPPRTFSI